jgi:hypothetical protein
MKRRSRSSREGRGRQVIGESRFFTNVCRILVKSKSARGEHPGKQHGGDPDASFHDPQNPVEPATGLWPSLGTVRNDIGAYGGQGRASFPLSLQVTSAGASSGDRPQGFLLKQNYPNPFNPSTRIDYQIPAAGKVSLRIFDVLGREVGDLVHEDQAGAAYSVIWNASSLASGVYFYRLTVTTDKGKLFTETESLTLLK